MAVSLIAAIAGMLLYGAGSVLQAVGAKRATGPKAVIQPMYLVGIGCDLAAWVASLVALHHLPLFSVQAILAGSLAVTVILARSFLKLRLLPRDYVAIGAVAVALAFVAISAGSDADVNPTAGFNVGLLVSLGVVAALTLLFYKGGRPMPLAVLSGLAYSGAAVGARALERTTTLEQVVLSPDAWAIVGFGALGVLAYARALEKGNVGPVTAVMWVVEVIVPGIIGVVLLGDTVRAGWDIPAIAAVLVAVAGCVVLAFSPAQVTD